MGIHSKDTCQTLTRHPPDNFHTSTRQSPKIRPVGSFLLLKARWGLFLPSFFFFFFLLPWENKVNSYSNQLKLSWVCKLEWSLTIKARIKQLDRCILHTRHHLRHWKKSHKN